MPQHRVPCSVSLVSLVLLAGSAYSSETKQVADLSIASVALTHLDSDSASFQLAVSGTALHSATVKAIFFQHVTVNDLPITLPPLRGPLKLHQGQEIQDIPVMTALLQFRELPSLKPLRDMVSQGAAQVHAACLIQLELNLIEMFALRTTDAWVATRIDKDISIDLPGGFLGRTAALAGLSAAEPIWIFGNQGNQWRQQRSALAARAESELAPLLVAVQVRYRLRSRQGEATTMLHSAMGFLLDRQRVLTTAEALEPWSFDPALAEAMSRHEISILPDSIETTLTMNSLPAASLSSQRNEISIEMLRGNPRRMIAAQDKKQYHLRFQSDAENAAIIHLNVEQPSNPGSRIGRIQDDGEWQSAAIVGSGTHATTLTEVKIENGRLVFRDSAGLRAIGSPVSTESGVVGLVQEDNSAVPIASLRRKFHTELF